MKLFYFLISSLTLSICLEMIQCQFKVKIKRSRRRFINVSRPSFAQARYNLKGSKYSITLANVDNVYYYGIVQVGNPPQSFRVNFDTGSADFWLISSDCTSSACAGHRKYNKAKSKTFVSHNKNFLIGYGDGSSVQGRTAYDVLTLGPITIKKQGFAMITTQKGMDGDLNDGIMGLAFKSVAMSGFDTPIDNAFNSKQIKSKIVSFYLNQDFSSENGGSITFGDIDSSRISGQITYVPVSKRYYWQFDFLGVYTTAVNGTTTKICKANCNAIVDTGTTLIWGPQAQVNQINSMINAKYQKSSGMYLMDCNSRLNLLPDIKFAIGNRNFVLSYYDYVFYYYGICYSSFMPTTERYWILGDVFLGKYYSIYDSTSNRIGFADKK